LIYLKQNVLLLDNDITERVLDMAMLCANDGFALSVDRAALLKDHSFVVIIIHSYNNRPLMFTSS